MMRVIWGLVLIGIAIFAPCWVVAVSLGCFGLQRISDAAEKFVLNLDYSKNV